MKLYKVLNGSNPINGGSGEYSLPTKQEDGEWIPGEWMPEIGGALEPCFSGYHLCRDTDLITWLGPDIYEAECRGEMIEDENKVVCRQVRLTRKLETWNEKTSRLFACWCVRQVWHLLDDARSKEAIETAERYANGLATEEELAAARDDAEAAWSVLAFENALMGVWPIVRTVWAALAAMEAAGNGSLGAAGSIASDAARTSYAAWDDRDAARAAQTERLVELLGIRERKGE